MVPLIFMSSISFFSTDRLLNTDNVCEKIITVIHMWFDKSCVTCAFQTRIHAFLVFFAVTSAMELPKTALTRRLFHRKKIRSWGEGRSLVDS